MGCRGVGVVLYVDEGTNTLLEFHSGYNEKRGESIDTVRVLSPQVRDGVQDLIRIMLYFWVSHYFLRLVDWSLSFPLNPVKTFHVSLY